MALLGLNSGILGLAQGNIGRRDEMHRDYWEGTIVHTSQSDIIPPLQEFLVPEFGDDLVLTQDFSNVKPLQENEEIRSTFAQRYWNMGVPITVLNKRFRLGFDPVDLPDGDMGFVASRSRPWSRSRRSPLARSCRPATASQGSPKGWRRASRARTRLHL